MVIEKEYDTYCAYRHSNVVISEYNRGGSFEHLNQNGLTVVISSWSPCMCIDCDCTDSNKCGDCDWPKKLEKEFAKCLKNRCISCMAQYKRNGYLR